MWRCEGCIIPLMPTARRKPTTASRKPRNSLQVEPVPMSELGKPKPRKALHGSTRGRRVEGHRKPPPVPKGKSREEIAEMDPDDPAFKHQGARRIPLEEREAKGVRSVAQMDKQNRANARRANVRKWEAEIVAAQRESSSTLVSKAKTFEVAEAQLIATGEMSFDDWTDEELIRGYRKNRSGKFGPPPKWVASEVVQELHRRILKRGGKKMLRAYLQSVDALIELSRNAESEKVKLEAIKELQNRVAGKVPDRVAVSADDPWQDMLADAYVLPSELPPLDVEGTKRDASVAPTPDAGGSAVPPVASVVEAQGRPSNGHRRPPPFTKKAPTVEEFGDYFDE